MLKQNCNLITFLLHWNYFREKGGIDIFQGLEVNDKVLVFDISNNLLG